MKSMNRKENKVELWRDMVKLQERYEKLYSNIKSGKYDTAVADENTFKMKTSISFIDLLKDCDKEGVNVESFLRYAKEQKSKRERS